MNVTNFFKSIINTGSLVESYLGTISPLDVVPPSTTGASYAIEKMHALLTPFHYPTGLQSDSSHPLSPILRSGGLAFPYTPSISEGVNIQYDNISMVQSNESYNVYRSTDNQRINISDAIWTCDTFDNALYALSVIHFLRSYSLMDFGRGKTGRPPSPMWFSAYGNYAFNRVPVLFEKADWSFPSDIDYVGIPEPGSPEFANGILNRDKNASGNYTWLPIKFTVNSISLIVQHTPRYWINFNLDDYYSGAMLKGGGSFHTTQTSPSIVSPIPQTTGPTTTSVPDPSPITTTILPPPQVPTPPRPGNTFTPR